MATNITPVLDVFAKGFMISVALTLALELPLLASLYLPHEGQGQALQVAWQLPLAAALLAGYLTARHYGKKYWVKMPDGAIIGIVAGIAFAFPQIIAFIINANAGLAPVSSSLPPSIPGGDAFVLLLIIALEHLPPSLALYAGLSLAGGAIFGIVRK